MTKIKSSNIDGALSTRSFAVTDFDYGKTADIYKCLKCGLLQCSKMTNIIEFYKNLDDMGYEESRDQRALQMQRILDIITKFKESGTLLDIGAATGIFVELALAQGFAAKGIEPSNAFYTIANQRNLPVYHGIFPHPAIDEDFDIITLIDVLEHVEDPVTMLENISKTLKKNGIGLVITPDVSSVAARIMGWKWWHYRIAHINYFNQKTLQTTLDKAGLIPIFMKRPAWYFRADYLFHRVIHYFPFEISCPNYLQKMVIPLNLFDSWLVVFKKKNRWAQ